MKIINEANDVIQLLIDINDWLIMTNINDNDNDEQWY